MTQLNKKLILGLYEYYSFIDFDTLSKVEIKNEPINSDGINIFALSNIMHKLIKSDTHITEKQQKYINLIIDTYGKK